MLNRKVARKMANLVFDRIKDLQGILLVFWILLCIGRLDRLHYLFLYPRIQSPITWDIIAIMTDLIGCFIYLYMTFIPDFAILRDDEELDVAPWRKKVYRFLNTGRSQNL